LLASQTLDENFKFHTELKDEEQKQILLSFVAGTSRSKMTSTTHGPSEASAGGLGFQTLDLQMEIVTPPQLTCTT
jgi:hypothetical protein